MYECSGSLQLDLLYSVAGKLLFCFLNQCERDVAATELGVKGC
jgi:hypothetical protein